LICESSIESRVSSRDSRSDEATLGGENELAVLETPTDTIYRSGLWDFGFAHLEPIADTHRS